MLLGRAALGTIAISAIVGLGCQQDECASDDDCERNFECTNIGKCREKPSLRVPPPVTEVPDSGVLMTNDGAPLADTGVVGPPRDGGVGPTPDSGVGPTPDSGVGDTGIEVFDSGQPPGTFDPTHVYYTGQWTAGGGDAIVDMTDPTAPPIAGFPAAAFPTYSMIQPSTSRLFYMTQRQVFIMRTDGFVGGMAPTNPEANDYNVRVECGVNNPVYGVWSHPTSEDVVYTCLRAGHFDLAHRPVLQNLGTWELRTRGYGDLMLLEGLHTATTSTHGIWDGTGPIRGVRDLPLALRRTQAVRAHPNGFYLAWKEELWNVDTTGQATLVGTYPSPPMGVLHFPDFALDTAGDLYTAGGLCEICEATVVVRKSVAGRSEIIWDNSTGPPLLVSGTVNRSGFLHAP